MSRKLFCEYSPITYEISLVKETIKKDIEDYFIKKYNLLEDETIKTILNTYGRAMQKFYLENCME